MAPDHATAIAYRRTLGIEHVAVVAEAIQIAFGTQVWLVGATRYALHFSDEDQELRVEASAVDHALLVTILRWQQPQAHITLGAGRRYLDDPEALARVLPTF